jgi:hypothetical protein
MRHCHVVLWGGLSPDILEFWAAEEIDLVVGCILKTNTMTKKKPLEGWDLNGGQRLIGTTPHESAVARTLAVLREEEERRRYLTALRIDLQNIPDDRLAQYTDGSHLIALKHKVGSL